MVARLRPEYILPRSLAALAERFALDVHGELGSTEISSVAIASDAAGADSLFVALPGAKTHGANFAQHAVEHGAVAVLTDPAGAALLGELSVPVLVCENPRAALGQVSAWLYRTGECREPTYSELIFGVTGTNGKTSVVYILSALLEQLGRHSALSSTAERRVGELVQRSGLTTPEANELHAMLALARERDVRAIAIEVSAQALSRHRVDGIVFDVAGFSNLSHDHLDDYGDMESYFAAKSALFSPERAKRAVITIDSDWGERLLADARIPVSSLSSTGQPADWLVQVTAETASYTEFSLSHHGALLHTRIPLLGAFSASNAGLAIAMLVEAGIPFEHIREQLERDGELRAFVPGRAEPVSRGEGPLVLLDYGHTPDAFRQLLAALRRVTPGRIIWVFGADGDRDPSKRSEMGAIAARGADLVVVTDFHPRTENPESIRATLIAGARAAVPEREIAEIADPREAIRFAVAQASEHDVVVYAGPGHEEYHEVNGVKIPYSAREAARAALQEAGWSVD